MISTAVVCQWVTLVCTPISPLPAGEGGLSLLPNFQKGGGLGRISFLEEVIGLEEATFFRERGGGGVAVFYIKSKVKSELCNDKKS